MKVLVLALSLLCCTLQTSFAADTVRICTYNALKFNASNEDGRIPHFRRILDSIRPDVLLCQEVDDASLGARFVGEVLTWTPFAASPYINGPDTDCQILFAQDKFDYLGQRRITTTLRDIAEFTIATRPTNGLQPDTLVLYAVHLKASDDASSASQRTQEVRRLIAGMTNASYAVIAGDFNIYSPQEAAYTELVGPAATRRFVDPLGTTWARNTAAYAQIYTQCTRQTTMGSCGGGVDGGVDDRFDYILVSTELAPRIVQGSYTPFGNDGVARLNSAIDNPPNQRVSADMAAALKCASDHLPVYVDIILGDLQAGVEGAANNVEWLHLLDHALEIDVVRDRDVVQIYDMQGRLWADHVLIGPTARISVAGLPAGVYGVRAGTRWASFVLP
ncbi:MAG: hypothetical protein FGM24_01290 [Candidatus Kapabacteria bacterium]|nr:hypothetical protein [Candidatus Kapabacteria bacterium]